MATAFLFGFGKVGRELVKLLLGTDQDIELVGVTSSRGTVLTEGPRDKAELLRLAREGRKLHEHPSFIPGLLAPDSAVAVKPDIVFIAIPPSYETGEPNRTIYKALVEEGINIVTADKTVLALHYNWIKGKAEENGALLGYRATVAAGTPAIDAARALRYRGVESLRAVLNATSNYVLGLVEQGLSLSEAIERSIKYGLAEPDPSIDLHGWDAAAKLTILANELGLEAALNDVDRVPLTEEAIGSLAGEKARVKQVASLRVEEGKAVLRVAPEAVLPGDPLYYAEGERNVILYYLEGDMIRLEGPAGPAWRTARVMLADALEILRAS